MTLSLKADFVGSKEQRGGEVAVDDLIAAIGEKSKALVDWPVDRIIDVVDTFGSALLDRSNKLHKRYPGSGIPFIARWCRREHLETLLDSTFRDRRLLDGFLPDPARSDRSYRAYPRGLIVHWMAGNVPTIGFLSLIQGILTKNGNVIKLASESDLFLADLLELLAESKAGEERDGAALAATVAVVRYDHTRRTLGERLSQAADVRVMWGSDDSVREIRRLAARPGVVDLVFGNKVSLILIGASALARSDYDRLARRIATDVSVFEQKACASPHTIFLETKDPATVERMAKALNGAMTAALRTFPKTPPSQKEVATVLNLRAQYDILYEAWYSSGTEFTILHDDLFQLGPAIGNRVVYLRCVDSLDRVAELLSAEVQSVGIAADEKQFEHLTDLLGACGVQRFVPLGTMTHFEVPWDGYFSPQYMVRWVSRPRAARVAAT